MIDHTGTAVADWAKSKTFYDAVLRATLRQRSASSGVR